MVETLDQSSDFFSFPKLASWSCRIQSCRFARHYLDPIYRRQSLLFGWIDHIVIIYTYYMRYPVRYISYAAYDTQYMILFTSSFSMLLWYLLNIVRFFEFGFSYNRVIIQVCCTFSILYENETKESQITFGQTHLFLKVVLTDFGEILWNLLAVSSILMEVSKIWYKQHVIYT